MLPGSLKAPVTIIIKPHSSIDQISNSLASNSVIDNKTLFRFAAKIYSIKKPLKSGEYIFTNGINPINILRILSSGKSIVHHLRFPEGYSVHQIIEIITKENRLFGEIKQEIPEGYLLPNTYYYSYGDKKSQIIDQMRFSMSQIIDKAMLDLDPKSPIKTRKELLILASIVEKEAQLDSERPLIAAVFLNRLNRGMRLQADPTNIYAITFGKYKLSRSLSKADLKLNTPYNTYLYQGLPPSAIACPGAKSIEAVVRPAKTDAIFFVVNGSGGHNFSSDLKSHNDYVNQYRARVSAAKQAATQTLPIETPLPVPEYKNDRRTIRSN